MILFENTIVKLDYNPATDILDVAYPDLHSYLLPEIKHSVDILVDTVKYYDVKKLLLDSSKTVIAVNAEESREITTYLASGLRNTRVEKVARVQSPNNEVETTAHNNITYVTQAQLLTFQLQNFSNKAEALKWLKSTF